MFRMFPRSACHISLMPRLFSKTKSVYTKPLAFTALAALSGGGIFLAKNYNQSTIGSPNYVKLDRKSVIQITSGSDQVVVYGWKHCKYEYVQHAISYQADEEPNFPIRKVFDFYDCIYSKTLEGRTLNRISGTTFKSGLTNITLENVKRIKENLPVIPVIFCLDIDDNPYPFTVADMLSKQPKFNRLITNSEGRRICKLSLSENPEIKQAAEKTFKFVKLKLIGKNTYALEEITAPYLDSNYHTFLKARKAQSTSKPKPANKDWKAQMDAEIKSYNRNGK